MLQFLLISFYLFAKPPEWPAVISSQEHYNTLPAIVKGEIPQIQ